MFGKLVFLFVGIAALAVVASASLEEYLEDLEQKETSIEQLNDWLEANVKDNDEPEANLKEAPRAIAANPGLKPLVDAMQTIATANGCDSSVRKALRLFITVNLYGRSRIEEVLSHYISKISTKACVDALEKEFEAAAQFDDPRVNALMKRFESVGLDIFLLHQDPKHWFHKYLSAPSAYHLEQDRLKDLEEGISADIASLAGHDSKAKIFEWKSDEQSGEEQATFYPENYKYAFETYLLKPCQQFTAKTEAIFEDFAPVSRLLTNPTDLKEFDDRAEYRTTPDGLRRIKKWEYPSAYLAANFQTGVLTYKRCRLIEEYDEAAVNRALGMANIFIN